MSKRTKAAARERLAAAHIAALGHAERAYRLLRDSPWPGSAFASAQRHIAMAAAIRLAARYGVDVTAPFEADDETAPETGPTLPLSALDAGAHPSVTPGGAQAVSEAAEDDDPHALRREVDRLQGRLHNRRARVRELVTERNGMREHLSDAAQSLATLRGHLADVERKHDALRDEYLQAVAARDRYAAVIARLRRRVGEALADAGATCTCGHTSGAHAIREPHPCMADDDGDSGLTCPCFGFTPEGS